MNLSLVRNFSRAAPLVTIGSLILASSCSPTLAQDHGVWRCDVANGKYDEKVIPISSKSTTISGQIRVNKADFSPEWNSLGKISFAQSTSADGNCHCSGVTFFAFPNPDSLEFRVTSNGEDVAVARGRFNNPITFKISIDPRGVMALRLGKDGNVLKAVTLLHPEHDTMVMSCSGADVSFLNVEVH